jgi:hypothetical protein
MVSEGGLDDERVGVVALVVANGLGDAGQYSLSCAGRQPWQTRPSGGTSAGGLGRLHMPAASSRYVNACICAPWMGWSAS